MSDTSNVPMPFYTLDAWQPEMIGHWLQSRGFERDEGGDSPGWLVWTDGPFDVDIPTHRIGSPLWWLQVGRLVNVVCKHLGIPVWEMVREVEDVYLDADREADLVAASGPGSPAVHVEPGVLALLLDELRHLRQCVRVDETE